MKLKNSRFLTYPATEKAIRAYLLDVGVPEGELDRIDIKAYADKTVSVKDIIESLANAYPSLSQYIYQEKTDEEILSQKIEYIKNILENIELYGDEIGILNITAAIDNIYNNEEIPEEKLFEIIEDLNIPLDQLSKKVKEAYLNWKYGLGKYGFQYEEYRPKRTKRKTKKKSEKQIQLPAEYYNELKSILEEAKNYNYLYIADILPKRVPITPKNVKRNLATILAHLTEEDIKTLYELAKESPEIYDILYNHLPAAISGLRKASYDITPNSYELEAIKLLFPRTYEGIVKSSIEDVYPKNEVIIKPKKVKLNWKGINLETKSEPEMELYGDIVVEHWIKWLTLKYPREEIEKAIEYVKKKYPHLDEYSNDFWKCVEAVLYNKSYKVDINSIFKKLGL